MVGASYNAELMARGFGTPSGGGVFLFTNEGGALKPDLLVSHAQALAVLLTDLDGGGRRDILVGNDFATPDEAFLNKPEGWIDAAPFERTTANTMGFAEGDTDNDGRFEIIGIDMKPYQEDPVWTPPLEGNGSMQADDGVQFVANTLQFRRGDPPVFVDEGGACGVDATGWSWSVQFGDLDNDGALDLYVVNNFATRAISSLDAPERTCQRPVSHRRASDHHRCRSRTATHAYHRGRPEVLCRDTGQAYPRSGPGRLGRERYRRRLLRGRVSDCHRERRLPELDAASQHRVADQ